MIQDNKSMKLGSIIKWSLNRVRSYKVQFALYLILGFVVIAFNLMVVVYTKKSINAVSGGADVFYKSVILLVLFLVGQLVFLTIQKRIGGKLNADVSFDLKKRYQNKVMMLSKQCEDEMESGDIISRFNHDINVISEYVPEGLYNTIFQVVRAVVAIIYLATIDIVLLVASIIILPVAMHILKKLQVKMGTYFENDNVSRGKSNAITNETIQNMNFVKAYNLQGVLYEKNKGYYGECLDSWIHIHKIFSPILMLTIVLREFPKLICICLGGWMALSGYLSVDELIGFVLLLEYIIVPITSIPNIIVSLTSAGAAICRYDEIFNMEEERKDGTELKIDQDVDTVLVMQNVCFSYQEDVTILNNISFELRKGEHIALVGESGSGKSSIISLLMGDYRASSGKILFYGQDAEMISLESIRNTISLVSQNITILPRTIRENIAFGSKKDVVTDEMVRAAAKISGADRFIEKLPEQYDTLLQEGESNLSGGQKQVIAIARAFLKDAPVILLDEPTSALDAETELIVKNALKKLEEDKSVIIISHRFSTINDADRLLVLQDGQIIDEGTHDDLMNRCEYYKKLYLVDIETSEERGEKA